MRVRHGGFTLIEILIAVVVLSIGLLGVATLQLTSKRGNFEAMQRASATLYAEDLVERMRSNPEALDTYVAASPTTYTAGSPPAAANPDCSAAECDVDELAEYDLDVWWDLVTGQSEGGAGGLVEPTACLFTNVDAGTGNTEHIVAIAWRGMDSIPDTASATGVAALDTARDCGRGGYDLDAEVVGRSNRRVITLFTYLDPFSG